MTITHAQLVLLKERLIKRLTEADIRDVCFDLELDYEDVPGPTKSDKIRELLSKLEREDRVAALIDALRRLRPDISLDDVVGPNTRDAPPGDDAAQATHAGTDQPTPRGRLLWSLGAVTALALVVIAVRAAGWPPASPRRDATPSVAVATSAAVSAPTVPGATLTVLDAPTAIAPGGAVAPTAAAPDFPITPTPPLAEAIVTRFRAPGDTARGIAWDGASVWVPENMSVFQLKQPGPAIENYGVPDVTPGGIAWDGSAWWLYTSVGYRIHRFRYEGRTVVPLGSIPAPVQLTGGGISDDLAWDGEALWFVSRFVAYRLDASGGEIGRITAPREIAGVAWDGQHLLLAFNDLEAGASVDVYTVEGELLESRRMPVYVVEALDWADTALWVLGRDSLAGEQMVYLVDWRRLAP